MHKLGALLRNFWLIARRPSSYFSVAFLTLGGFIGGVIFWGGFNTALEFTNTEEFCISCHAMRDNPYQEMQTKIHFVNRTGVRATCSDCHVPKNWTQKIARKMQASKEVWGHIFGTINTPEKFEAHRAEMALVVWSSMKASNSRECRNCHEKVWMDLSAQWGGAQRNHRVAIENDLTCIDCHQGIAHRLPQEFEPPTLEQLVEDASAWLRQLEPRN